MGKTLYISDLDGTLLNEKGEISDYSRNVLNKFTESGGNFSIASARTAHSTGKIFKNINLKLPTVQMNGVFLYDWSEEKYLQIQYLEQEKVRKILNVLENYPNTPLIYTIENNCQTTFYTHICNEFQQEFYDLRKLKYGQEIPQVENPEELENVIYFTFVDTRENLLPLSRKIAELEGISSVFYEDIGTTNGSYLLEVFSETASKSNGVLRLKKLFDFEKIVCFGDNYNDMSLFDICDEFYAVSNAVDEIKSKSTKIIGANTEDGVARWLEENVICHS
jgi:Cof subfamily protein (haloacid dehalogenase superfamily)